tara:strand:- start:165 stop:410 length:246 start_codon:yes stop_codon:yes gene_type:complete
MSVYNNLFGPLDSDYCVIFFVLMVISFIYLALTVLLAIGYMFSSKKKDGKVFGFLFTNAIILAIAYFAYRTLYSMCLSSLR